MKILNINKWDNSYKEFYNLYNKILYKKKGGNINKIKDLQKAKRNTYKIIKEYDRKKFYNLDNTEIIKNVRDFQISYINPLFTYFTNLFSMYYDTPLDYILKNGEYKIFSKEMPDSGEIFKYLSFLNIANGTIIRICIKPNIIIIEYSKKALDQFQQIHISIFDKERGFHLTEETTQNYHLLKINELSGLLKNRSKRPVSLQDIKVDYPEIEPSNPSEKSTSLRDRLGLSSKRFLDDKSPINNSSGVLQLITKKRKLEDEDKSPNIQKIQELHNKSIIATLAMNTAKKNYDTILKTNDKKEIEKSLKEYNEKIEDVEKLATIVKKAINEKETPKKTLSERLNFNKKGGKNEQLYQVDNVEDIYDFYVGIKNILYEIKKLGGVSIQGENLTLAVEYLNEMGNFIKSIIIDNYDILKIDEIEEIKKLKFDVEL